MYAKCTQTPQLTRRSPQFAFSLKTPHTAPPKKLASSSARPQAAALRDEVVSLDRGGIARLTKHIALSIDTQLRERFSRKTSSAAANAFTGRLR